MQLRVSTNSEALKAPCLLSANAPAAAANPPSPKKRRITLSEEVWCKKARLMDRLDPPKRRIWRSAEYWAKKARRA